MKINYVTIKSNNKKWNKIIKEYDLYVFLNLTDKKVPYAIVYYLEKTGLWNVGEIYFREEVILNPTENDLFDLLHEIGHIMTNKKGMKRCVEEYLATQWALDNMKKYHINISKLRIESYQDYILSWRNRSLKRNIKNLPTIEELTLQY